MFSPGWIIFSRASQARALTARTITPVAKSISIWPSARLFPKTVSDSRPGTLPRLAIRISFLVSISVSPAMKHIASSGNPGSRKSRRNGRKPCSSVKWSNSSIFSSETIFSTIGRPYFLASSIAIVLPIASPMNPYTVPQKTPKVYPAAAPTAGPGIGAIITCDICIRISTTGARIPKLWIKFLRASTS